MSRHTGEPRWYARCLDAAGITDAGLRLAYERCRQVNAEHGRTYYLSALLLPPDRRPHVFALYAFSRTADEFVDDLDHPDPQGLLTWGDAALAGLAGRPTSDPVVRATAATRHRFDLDLRLFEDFLAAMRLDIDTTRYATFADLRGYMWGSAAVIGLMMLPLLEPLDERATDRATALGEAFQLTNFIRDVGEDLQRGRVYLPLEDLARFGVGVDDLEAGVVTDRVRDLLAFEVARTRELLRYAAGGIPLVAPQSRPCLDTALRLYGGILDEVERAGYQVLTGRVAVPDRRRLAVAVPNLVRAVSARREAASWRRAEPV